MNRLKLIGKHILHYGGLWLVGITLYILFLWMLPIKMTGTWQLSINLHAIVGCLAWAAYGISKFADDL
jgi:hypothetical protein